MNKMVSTKPKIIAIPFAGGNKYSFSEIQKHILQDFEWITLELPGRGSRFDEPLLNKVSDMVNDLFKNIQIHISRGNYIICGHSMGTLLGYELVKKLIAHNLKLPRGLFFTGRGAPGHSSLLDKKSILPQESFWEEITKIGGMPKDILEQKELLDVYYPILKSDFRAVEDYIYTKIETPFPIPIHILMGEDEIGEEEELTSINDMKAWANETNATCSFEIVPGNHFFVLDKPKMIAQKIMNSF
ncbi:MAG: thioesterase domain-containing protein [Bacteroidota bacterium]